MYVYINTLHLGVDIYNYTIIFLDTMLDARETVSKGVVRGQHTDTIPLCDGCRGREATLSCPCEQRIYCGDECHALDWKNHWKSCSTVDDEQKKAVAATQTKASEARLAEQKCDHCRVKVAILQCACGQRVFCGENCKDLDFKEHRWVCSAVPEAESSAGYRAAVERHEARPQFCDFCKQKPAIQACSCMQRNYCGDECVTLDWKLHRWLCPLESGGKRSATAGILVERQEARSLPRHCSRCLSKKATVSCPCTQRSFCDDQCFALDWKNHRWVCPTVPEKNKWSTLRTVVEEKERKVAPRPPLNNGRLPTSLDDDHRAPSTQASGTPDIPIVEKRSLEVKVSSDRDHSKENQREKESQPNKKLRVDRESSGEGPSRRGTRDMDRNSKGRQRESRESSGVRDSGRHKEDGRGRDRGRSGSVYRQSEKERESRKHVDRLRDERRSNERAREERRSRDRAREERRSRDQKVLRSRDQREHRSKDGGWSKDVHRDKNTDANMAKEVHSGENGSKNIESRVTGKTREGRGSRDEGIPRERSKFGHHNKNEQVNVTQHKEKVSNLNKKVSGIAEGPEDGRSHKDRTVDSDVGRDNPYHRSTKPTEELVYPKKPIRDDKDATEHQTIPEPVKSAGVPPEKKNLLRQWTEESMPIPKKGETFKIRVPKKGKARIAHVLELSAVQDVAEHSPLTKIHTVRPNQNNLSVHDDASAPKSGGGTASNAMKSLKKGSAHSLLRKQTSGTTDVSGSGDARTIFSRSSNESEKPRVNKTKIMDEQRRGLKKLRKEVKIESRRKRKLSRGMKEVSKADTVSQKNVKKDLKMAKMDYIDIRPKYVTSDSSDVSSGSEASAKYTDGNSSASELESEDGHGFATDPTKGKQPVCTICGDPDNSQGEGGMDYLFVCATPSCNNAGHGSCYGFTSVLVDNLFQSDRPWYCNYCKKCTKCGSTDEVNMYLCEYCDSGTHLACCDPPRKKRPSENEDWFCKLCTLYGNGAGIGLQPIPGEYRPKLFTSAKTGAVSSKPTSSGESSHEVATTNKGSATNKVAVQKLSAQTSASEGKTTSSAFPKSVHQNAHSDTGSSIAKAASIANNGGMRAQLGLTNSPFAIVKPNATVPLADPRL
ncbi:hypothetical protein SARC_05961 [Sphaeroforma arctica JP610]|uniref:PHD-type domain-containing protein n=1 Tax=Sphaeroforma arctica JP610 TaxID=667725 RepID=A0A0L0FY12_9EUKA|nr:hypothetical protein SARC_05961 [Sphaeroforma arctica JP610]KNC81720.1 hypothetical protein SARC_05961 [Sphaeroforma arctica JP610]|eukprot:XP_014155622.1 hypothetical protein SARC_05961 [Sphaeroforma arctica JP610]